MRVETPAPYMTVDEFVDSLGEGPMANPAPVHSNRFWLNHPDFHEDAYMSTTIRRGDRWIDATVKIADCSRSINLDFDIYGGEEAPSNLMDNNIEKIDSIIKELQAFRRVLKREYKKLESKTKVEE